MDSDRRYLEQNVERERYRGGAKIRGTKRRYREGLLKGVREYCRRDCLENEYKAEAACLGGGGETEAQGDKEIKVVNTAVET
jgi:hypothetical protein